MAETSSRVADGSLDFSSGVDSSKVTTIKSQDNPGGLDRNQLAWLHNGTVRGGGISPRNGWIKTAVISPNPAQWGGGIMYLPPEDNLPWFVCVVGGKLYEVRLDRDNSVHQIVPGGPLSIPDRNGYVFRQGEEFLIIQPFDGVTNPIFYYPTMPYTGAMVLRQSNGYVSPSSPTNELPAAGPMDYYQGRMWYARGRTYAAGDIVGNQASGTVAYNFRDSILHVTENPIAIGGDGFSVPSQDGNIRAIAHTSNVNATLGDGDLYIFTRKNVYTLAVPVSRVDWIASDANNQPRQKVAQQKYGSVGERCVVSLNGDLFYRTMEPGVRSIALALRYANQWGNTPISANEDRLLALDDRSLLRYVPGIEFDNRLLQGAMPVNIPGVGPVFRGIAPLDFYVVSNLQDKLQGDRLPAWEGSQDGVDVLQLFTADFGGRERAFAAVFSRTTGAIELWEMTNYSRTDGTDVPIEWYFETPAYTWNEPFSLKQLDGAEIWVDQMSGTVDFKAYYRPDGYPCWIPWMLWSDCASRGPGEDIPPGGGAYPAFTNCDQYRMPYSLPKPGVVTIPGWDRPSNIGYQFQFKLEIRGWCRVRGLILYGLPRTRPSFAYKYVGASPALLRP